MIDVKPGDVAWLYQPDESPAIWPVIVGKPRGRAPTNVAASSMLIVKRLGLSSKPERVSRKDVILCSTRPADLDFCDSDLVKACENASAMIDDKQSWIGVKVNKCAVTKLRPAAVVTLEQCSQDTEAKAEETDDVVGEDVLKKCNDARQNFLNSLSDDDSENDENDKKDDGDEDYTPNNPDWKPVLGTRRKPFAPISTNVNIVKEELSDYEKLRLANIEKQNRLFLDAMKAAALDVKPVIHVPKGPRRNFGHRRSFQKVRKFYSTRYARRNSLGSEQSSKWSSSDDEPESDDDDFYEELPPKKRRLMPHKWLINPNTDVLSPDAVTDAMLDNVADYVSQKVYSPNGTTCHQCRQKTLDTKSVCRSGRCAGGRGFFCGVCLRNRYGQDVRVVLKDPNWECPSCTDSCNCSICRNRSGKGATGILTALARERGHLSVHHYLVNEIAK